MIRIEGYDDPVSPAEALAHITRLPGYTVVNDLPESDSILVTRDEGGAVFIDYGHDMDEWMVLGTSPDPWIMNSTHDVIEWLSQNGITAQDGSNFRL